MNVILETFEVDLEWKDVGAWEAYETLYETLVVEQMRRTGLSHREADIIVGREQPPPTPMRTTARVAVPPDYAGRDLARVGEIAVNALVCQKDDYVKWAPMVTAVRRLGSCICVMEG